MKFKVTLTNREINWCRYNELFLPYKDMCSSIAVVHGVVCAHVHVFLCPHASAHGGHIPQPLYPCT